MPLRSSFVGARSGALRIECDDRWVMAYAAGLGFDDAQYLDTLQEQGPLAHPLFPVAPEWALRTDETLWFDLGLRADEQRRHVHAAHRVDLHRPLRAGLVVDLQAEIVGIDSTRAGARMHTLFRAVDADGEPAWTSTLVSMFRGVDVDGEDRPTDAALLTQRVVDAAAGEHLQQRRELAAGAAHVYTECARIWNPIHTDARVARDAGLPGTILHGTATLAIGVSAAVELDGADIARVRTIAGTFSAMVLLPTTLETDVVGVRELPNGGRVLHFQVSVDGGAVVVRDGYVALAT